MTESCPRMAFDEACCHSYAMRAIAELACSSRNKHVLAPKLCKRFCVLCCAELKGRGEAYLRFPSERMMPH